MRLFYIDEAGTGKILDEPILVLAAVALNPDQDWRELQRHIKAIRRKHLPSEDRENFIFHAKDIFHGTGYFRDKDRRQWPREKRLSILADLIDIPRRFGLPVLPVTVDRIATGKMLQARHQARARGLDKAFNEGRRKHFSRDFGAPLAPLSDRVIAIRTHIAAWARCAGQIDEWMKRHASNEVAMLVAENPGKVQRYLLKALHAGYADDETYESWAFTTHQIVDTVTFAEKHESILLQIADACAFVIRRHLQGKENTKEFFDILDRQLALPISTDPVRPEQPRAAANGNVRYLHRG